MGTANVCWCVGTPPYDRQQSSWSWSQLLSYLPASHTVQVVAQCSCCTTTHCTEQGSPCVLVSMLLVSPAQLPNCDRAGRAGPQCGEALWDGPLCGDWSGTGRQRPGKIRSEYLSHCTADHSLALPPVM